MTQAFGRRMTRRWLPVVAALLLAAATVGAVVSRREPLPGPDEVRLRMQKGWQAALPYDGSVGVRVPQSRSHESALIHCDSSGQRIVAAANMAGFRRVERLLPARRWQYFQFGLDRLFDVRLEKQERAPCLPWRLTGFPSPGDIIAHLATADDLEVRSRYRSGGEKLLAVHCSGPGNPSSELSSKAKATSQFSFERDVLEKPWQIAVSEESWLPVRLLAGDPLGDSFYEVRWMPVPEADRARRARWIDDPDAKLYRRRPDRVVRLKIRDACSSSEIELVEGRIFEEVNAWMSNVYR